MVLKTILDRVIGLALGVMLCGVCSGQAAQNWKDRAEYDLAQEVGKAQGQKKIDLLDQWKQKYPDSDFKKDRIGIYISTYQAMNKPKEMYESSKEFLALDPTNFTVISYVASLAMGQNEPDQAEKAANQIIQMVPATFEPKNKPAGVTDEQWQAQKKASLALANSIIYQNVKNKKDPVATELYLRKELKIDDSNAQYSFDLGAAILAQKKTDRYPEAFWHLSRGAHLNGPGALPDAAKKQAQAYVERIYTQYKGSKKDLDKLIASSTSSAFPPDGFAIKTVQQELIEEEEELKKTNPQLALWIAVKKALLAADGEAYFSSSVKDSGVPPMKGKVLSHEPALKPKKIVVAVADATTPEVTITIADGGSLPGKADPGTDIEFEAVAKSFTQNPFMLNVEVEPNQIKGWPAPIPTTPAKKAAPGVKKGVPKKK